MASAQIEQQLTSTGVAQVIVVMKSATAGAAAAIPTSRGASRGPAAAVAAATVPGGITAGVQRLGSHFVLSERSQQSSLARVARDVAAHDLRGAARIGEADPPPYRVYPNLGVMLGSVTRAGLAALEADAAVASVTGTPEISLIRPSRTTAARLRAPVTWGIDALKVPDLWASGLTGQGVRVAHLDTGVDGGHPALRKAIASFAEFDLSGRRVSPEPDPRDSGDHGTHTAGTIAGRPVRGSHIGVAFEADLASALVIEGGDVVSRVLGGMDWAIEEGAHILSMSLGFRGWWEDFVPILAILRARNILPVIAVGNEGAGTSRSPGNYVEVLSIGAINRRLQVPLFSSSQLFDRPDPLVPDLVAPGEDVISAAPGRGYQSMDGTSMATPHIAGLAALLWQAKPDAGAAAIEQAIFGACSLPPGVAADRGHRGMPDGAAAFTALTGVPVTRKRVSVTVRKPATRAKAPAKPTAKRKRKTTAAAKSTARRMKKASATPARPSKRASAPAGRGGSRPRAARGRKR